MESSNSSNLYAFFCLPSRPSRSSLSFIFLHNSVETFSFFSFLPRLFIPLSNHLFLLVAPLHPAQPPSPNSCGANRPESGGLTAPVQPDYKSPLCW